MRRSVVVTGAVALVLREGEETFPLVDCAKAHVEAITERATGAA